MLIDDFLPAYDVASRHSIAIRASAEDTYAAVLRCDLASSWVARMLFALRGLSGGAPTTAVLDRVQRLGFVLLGEDAPREIVLGVVGQFWTRGHLRAVTPREFASFETPGFAKGAWNFSVTPPADGTTSLATETRVLCLDGASRRKFRLYWTAIRPFSGLIRREMLTEIRRRAVGSG